jgi:hypothetical protein
MPEAFSECAEILAEIRRLHLNWLAPTPDLAEYKAHSRLDAPLAEQQKPSRARILG